MERYDQCFQRTQNLRIFYIRFRPIQASITLSLVMMSLTAFEYLAQKLILPAFVASITMKLGTLAIGDNYIK